MNQRVITPKNLGDDKIMETFLLRNDENMDVEFDGELIGSASTNPNDSHPNYSGSAGRWVHMRLYKTEKGLLVLEEEKCTNWIDETNHNIVSTYETEADLIADLGTSKLSKELYESAGIKAVRRLL